LDPTAEPRAAPFEFRPVLDGSEMRPHGWRTRSAVVPLTSDDSYRHVFSEPVTLDASHPHVRVWAGVSAADDQSYVPAELPAAVLATLDATPGGQIRIDLPDETTDTYVLANPSDQAAFLAQIRTGEPARVERRFLMHALLSHLPGFEGSWSEALPQAVGFAAV